MSCIHRLLNALLRGLVIYAVLGSDWTHSTLHNRPADPANVATTGKPGRVPVAPLYSPPFLPHAPTSRWFSLGMPRNALRMGLECRVTHEPFPPFLHNAEDGCPPEVSL